MKDIIISILILILTSACSTGTVENKVSDKSPADKDTSGVTLSEAQIRNAAISIGKPERRNISSTLKVNGRIDVPPQNIVSVGFPLGGYLKSTDLLPGMPMRKGQVIGVLEDPQYVQLQQDFLSGKIKLSLLQKEYERQKELNANKAASDKIFQQAESDYKSQEVLVKALEKKLSLIGLDYEKLNEDNISKSINIYSPINGFVSKVDVNIGKYVGPTDVLFELINPQDIHLALGVFQKDISVLNIGQPVISYTPNNPDKKYLAKIILISRDVASGGTVEIHCHFEHYSKELVPGMFMNAEIETHVTDAVAVPEDAVVLFDKKQFVFVATGKDQFKLTEINTGPPDHGFVPIISSNAESLLQAEIVVKNAYALLMKMKNSGGEE